MHSGLSSERHAVKVSNLDLVCLRVYHADDRKTFVVSAHCKLFVRALQIPGTTHDPYVGMNRLPSSEPVEARDTISLMPSMATFSRTPQLAESCQQAAPYSSA